jgi:membrane-associated protein
MPLPRGSDSSGGWRDESSRDRALGAGSLLPLPGARRGRFSVARLARVNDLLADLLTAVETVDPVVRTLLAGLFVALETSVLLGLIVPGDTVVLVAATGIRSPAEYFALVAACIAGALVGGSIGFAIGRTIGPWLRRSRVGRLIGEKNWVRAERFLDHRGGIAVFVSRFLPVLHSLTPLTVGMSTLRYRTFMLWLTAASTIWSFAYASAGAAAAGAYRELNDQLEWAGYLFLGIIIVFLLGVWLLKKLLDRYTARFTSHPGDGDARTRED